MRSLAERSRSEVIEALIKRFRADARGRLDGDLTQPSGSSRLVKTGGT